MHLDAQQPLVLQDYLHRRGWLDIEENISLLEKPGEGNMNYTLRVVTPNRTLIVKQSRPYVEKYPTIAAPAERAVIEGRFYQKTQAIPMLAGQMPHLLGIDEENNMLILEDLGESSDFTFLYQPCRQLSEADARALTDYLSELHTHFSTERPDPAFTNRAMRALNYEHIINYPFQEDNGFDLNSIQPGLQELARPYKRDTDLKKRVKALGDVYVGNTPTGQPGTLLHGDYYPGSWLQTADGTKIIDPEFCFYGPAEFDLGVMVAHLMMAEQPPTVLHTVLTTYQSGSGFDEQLRKQFTGIEIMRRLIGLAQLPLSLSLGTKRDLLDEAYSLLS
ncbi:phosphotransferase [Spirosoma utsteinense]|uniref:5-methylthioribose kinase n=1 Tax=Spirosoma utsteinense TaxID=2585773 RepID=A0ABR6W0P2_9BACT|nr:phosphotransferase [Spirosoma utsteinense]MBC3783742.1 5-methylthioribose kinase [Spirosoma utsteinense]MBC3790115.1 5-methylthioribose kinase [Spirosoma utsteinense]